MGPVKKGAGGNGCNRSLVPWSCLGMRIKSLPVHSSMKIRSPCGVTASERLVSRFSTL